MSAMIRRHRGMLALLVCMLCLGLSWALVAHLRAAPAEQGAATRPAKGPPHGGAPVIAPDANPNVRSVVEAKRSGRHPERLDPMFLPKPFDKAAFEASPQAYLDVVEPGRVWQQAEAGPQVRRIRAREGKDLLRVAADGRVPLAVVVEPLAPVTFTSFDGGIFAENSLNSITLRANEKGEAAATFTATPGTVANIRILAASPLNSGEVQFVVTVEEAGEPAGD